MAARGAPDDPQRKANVKGGSRGRGRAPPTRSPLRASVIMASLALTEALIDGEGMPEAVERTNWVREAFRNMGIHPSMEAASMIERSAIWASVRAVRSGGDQRGAGHAPL